MDPKTRAQFAQLIHTFFDVFSKSKWDTGKCDLVHLKIDVCPGSKPVKLPHRRMPMYFKKDLRQKIDKILEHEVITQCHSPSSSSSMLVRKKKWSTQVYHRLSTTEKANKQFLPSLEEFFDTLEGICYLTFDMSRHFYQLPLEASSHYNTAFTIPFGSFKWLFMPMGPTGSPPVSNLWWKKSYVEKHNCILRRIHYLFSNCWRTFSDS